ncbi:MAG: PqqD family protein, partial [Acidobacteriota bacterium]
MKKENQTSPRARKERILVQELSDEVLVYDLENHKAHCLNKAAAAVWEHCDGTKSINDIALAAGSDLGAETDEGMVLYALDQLGKARLLEKNFSMPDGKPKLSRRELMRKAGIAAMIAIPVVTSILAPKALASATSCGSPCTPGSSECAAILN